MPLRAIIDNKEIISSFLTEEEWNELKDRIKSNSLDVIIYQTKKQGYLRRSKKGLQHFVHKKGELPENWKPESPQHLYVKNEVLLGCKDAGWDGYPEFKENDWEADVLALKGEQRIAFEVQWSSQTYDKTVERQNKYKRDNVRCCWLFRKPPKEFRNWGDELKADKEIPLFKIFEDENKDIKVDFYGKIFSVRNFIKILLKGKIKYSFQTKVKSKQKLTINFFETSCWKCGANQHSYFLQETVKSKCDLDMYLENSMWDDDDLKYDPKIINAVNDFTKTREGHQIHIGQIKKRYSKTAHSSYKSFGCYKCDAIFGDWFLNKEIMEARMDGGNIELIVEVELPEIKEDREHWCYNKNNDFCFK